MDDELEQELMQMGTLSLCIAGINEDCYCIRSAEHTGDHECTCGCTWENGNE